MSKTKPTKRSAEESIERYRNKIRKAEQRLEKKVGGPSAYIVGKYKNNDSSSSNQSDVSDGSLIHGVNETSGGDVPPPALLVPQTRPERSPRARTSLVAQEINQSVQEAESPKRRSVKPGSGLKVCHPGSVRQASPESSPSSHCAIGSNDKVQGSRNELANSINESLISLGPVQEDSLTVSSVLDQSTELLDVFSSVFSLSGEDIHSRVVEQWNPILKKGLSDEVKQSILQKYTTPANCTLLKAPTLNKEVAVIVDEHARYRDTNAQSKQDQMGLGLTALAKGITTLIEHRNDNYVKEAMIHIRDGCLLLADLHFERTRTRRILCGSSNQDIKSFICGVFGRDVNTRNPNNLTSIDVVFERDDSLFGLEAGKVFTKCPTPTSLRRAPHC